MAHGQMSIRSWTSTQPVAPSILEQLERVNRERGHFRDINHATLQEELATEGALRLSDSEDDEDLQDGEEQQDEDQFVSREELQKTKFEMIQKIATARNEVMMALDIVSLVASKDAPAAKQTMSPYLKDSVPTGSMGIDIWHKMPIDPVREEQDASLAYNIRLDALQKSADSILSAAKRFEARVKKETRYWDELLSVTQAGWSVCILPGQTSNLGIRFGMSESAPEFSRAGVVPLNTDEDGALSIDQSDEVRSRTARVLVKDRFNMVGSSAAANDKSGDTIQAQIRHARDALFDEELFREIEREARSIADPRVTLSDGSVQLLLHNGEDEMTVTIELQTREQAARSVAGSSDQDAIAQGVLATCRLLLCQAHRSRLKQRSQIPPPLSSTRPDRQTLPILRPLLVFSTHRQAFQRLNKYLETAAAMLDKLGVQHKLQLASVQSLLPFKANGAADLLEHFTLPFKCAGSIRLATPDTQTAVSLSIDVETVCEPRSSTTCTVDIDKTVLNAKSLEEAIWLADGGVARLIAASLVVQRSNWQLSPTGAVITDTSDEAVVPELEACYDSTTNEASLHSSVASKNWRLDSSNDGDLTSAIDMLTGEIKPQSAAV